MRKLIILGFLSAILIGGCANPAWAAFPSVGGSQLSSRASGGTADVVNLPASVAAGDLVLIFHFKDGTGTCTIPGPWVEIKDAQVNGGTTAHVCYGYLIASGGET